MPPEGAIELVEAARRIALLERQHFLEDVGMAADRALPELDQAAGHDIGAFDRDADRHRAIEIAEAIWWPCHRAFAAISVHGVIGGSSPPLGALRLHDGRHDRRLVTA